MPCPPPTRSGQHGIRSRRVGSSLPRTGLISFQGIDGKARWGRTAVEEALPVTCLPHDDRLEIPEGFEAVVTGDADHPILAGLGAAWPMLLGANEARVKAGPDVQILARLPDEQGGHPLLVTGRFGAGRTAVWTSDIGPHWLPQGLVEWPGYATLWKNLLGWVTEAPSRA